MKTTAGIQRHPDGDVSMTPEEADVAQRAERRKRTPPPGAVVLLLGPPPVETRTDQVALKRIL